jgi:hypothetical protein
MRAVRPGCLEDTRSLSRNRLRTSYWLKPLTPNQFVARFVTAFSAMAPREMFKCSTRKEISAAFAFPSTAGARSLILTPLLWLPTIGHWSLVYRLDLRFFFFQGR